LLPVAETNLRGYFPVVHASCRVSNSSSNHSTPLAAVPFQDFKATDMARRMTRASTAKTEEALHSLKKTVTSKPSTASSKRPLTEGVHDSTVKQEGTSPAGATRNIRKRASGLSDLEGAKRIKTENTAITATLPSPGSSLASLSTPAPETKTSWATKKSDLQTKKLKSHSLYANVSPFPTFLHPTPTEARLAHKILAHLHGPRTRPKEVVASQTRAGCGDSPSVLDALVRTILSQNTSDANSTRAKLSMDNVYGGSDNWASIVDGGEAKLQEAIKCGGLSAVKSKVIIGILRQVHEKYGKYSLDHLHDADTEDAYKEMLAFQGVGPKTASCVLLFCLRRESFAVDTHVWRISGLLGWRPKEAGREATQAHLEVRIPAEDKYGLHVLMVAHGKICEECKAGGKSIGKCELRKAFRKEKAEKEEDIKAEEEVET
jgi:endonuclease-3